MHSTLKHVGRKRLSCRDDIIVIENELRILFIQYKPLFARDRRSISTADETQLVSMKHFGVLYQRELLPLVAAMDTVPHLPGMVSISGGGDLLKPIVVLNDIQKVEDQSDLEPHCLIAAWQNGWIAKDLPIHYALVFSAQMSEYRLILHQSIWANEILLARDGHKNRLSF
jgi:hypothetical protein